MHFVHKKLLIVFRFLAITFGLISVVYANDFRHKDVRQKKQGYIYITVGLNIPLTNSVSKVDTIFNADFYNEIMVNADKLYTGKDTYPSQKIGAMAGLGYKLPYFLRFEAKLDFNTFTRKYYSSFLGIDLKPIDMTVRQFGGLIIAYLDFDNRTSVTPFIGGGGGFTFVSGSFYSRVTNDTILKEKSDDLTSKIFAVYEVVGGLRFGSKVASFSIEGFARKVPAVGLTSKGVMFKVNFQI